MSAFQPSDTFQGKRDGFHFKAGPEGTGYYPDAAPPAVPAGGRRVAFVCRGGTLKVSRGNFFQYEDTTDTPPQKADTCTNRRFPWN